jgi:hypothetical protein
MGEKRDLYASHATLGISLHINKKSPRRKHLIKVEKDKERQENWDIRTYVNALSWQLSMGREELSVCSADIALRIDRQHACNYKMLN